ncbi:MAG: helix-turn-helix domain-containing protein [Thermomicrobiales bacterium]
MERDEIFVPSTGNVFEDLGFDDPEEELAKADLSIEIVAVIRARGLTQVQAGKIMGIGQPKVSAIARGRLDGITTDALIGYLRKLGQNVGITVTPAEPIVRSPEPPRLGSFDVYGQTSHLPLAAADCTNDDVRFD